MEATEHSSTLQVHGLHDDIGNPKCKFSPWSHITYRLQVENALNIRR